MASQPASCATTDVLKTHQRIGLSPTRDRKIGTGGRPQLPVKTFVSIEIHNRDTLIPLRRWLSYSLKPQNIIEVRCIGIPRGFHCGFIGPDLLYLIGELTPCLLRSLPPDTIRQAGGTTEKRSHNPNLYPDIFAFAHIVTSRLVPA